MEEREHQSGVAYVAYIDWEFSLEDEFLRMGTARSRNLLGW
jgi:hypothetical protein